MSADSDHTLYMYPLADEAAAAAAAAETPREFGHLGAAGTGSSADEQTPAATAAATAAAGGSAASVDAAAAAAAARDAWMASHGTGRPGAPASANATNASDTVIVATVPDSGHWQHWLDRTSHVVMQVSDTSSSTDLHDEQRKICTGFSGDSPGFGSLEALARPHQPRRLAAEDETSIAETTHGTLRPWMSRRRRIQGTGSTGWTTPATSHVVMQVRAKRIHSSDEYVEFPALGNVVVPAGALAALAGPHPAAASRRRGI